MQKRFLSRAFCVAVVVIVTWQEYCKSFLNVFFVDDGTGDREVNFGKLVCSAWWNHSLQDASFFTHS